MDEDMDQSEYDRQYAEAMDRHKRYVKNPDGKSGTIAAIVLVIVFGVLPIAAIVTGSAVGGQTCGQSGVCAP